MEPWRTRSTPADYCSPLTQRTRYQRITPTSFARYLYCLDIPDADLIVRTGGEWRLSNFLLWRAARAVFWSTPTFWPEFQREHLLETIEIYSEQINRRETKLIP